jgi:hypothetical protein
MSPETVKYGGNEDDYLTDVVSRLGKDFIRKSGKERFFIEIATFAPHTPFIPSASRRGQASGTDSAADAGEDDNTYVVFISDNGLHLGEYSLRAGKMTPFDTDTHVPLVVVGPGVR